MRKVTPQEITEYVGLLNDADVARTRATLRFQELRKECGAPMGWAFDEDSGEWGKPRTAPNGEVTLEHKTFTEKFDAELRARKRK